MSRAKQMLDEGVIGEPISMRMKTIIGDRSYGWDVPESSMAWRFDQAINGGGKAILDYGYHIFAMGRWFLGEPEQVFAWIRTTYTPEGWGKRLSAPRVLVLRRRKDTRLMGAASDHRDDRPI